MTTANLVQKAKTTENERCQLRMKGFVRVDGLPVKSLHHQEVNIIGANMKPEEWGRYDSNNSKTVIVTHGGEIWLRNDIQHTSCIRKLIWELCQDRIGAFVPCSNGETPDPHHIVFRMADPDWDPGQDD